VRSELTARRTTWVPALVLGTALLAGCTGAVAVPEPTPDDADRTTCAALVAGLPDDVEGGVRRTVEPGVLTAAWGDPPITLRCGVAAPPGLTPSSECLEVNGVGWFSEDVEGGVLFTTIGRAAFVEVAVPADYTPPVNPLVDLAAAVDAHDPVEQPCR
jgi:hypothetical protein